jgi:hypothetical protein
MRGRFDKLRRSEIFIAIAAQKKAAAPYERHLFWVRERSDEYAAPNGAHRDFGHESYKDYAPTELESRRFFSPPRCR